MPTEDFENATEEAGTAKPAVDAAIEPSPEEKKRLAGTAFYKEKVSDYQRQLQESNKTNESLTAKLQQLETNQLKEKNDYKALYEASEIKRNSAEESAAQIKSSYLNGLKMQSIRAEAQAQGIHEGALGDLESFDNSMVQIETTDHGNANVLGAKEYVEQLKETKGYMFKNMAAPIINGAPPGDPTAIKTSVLSAKELVQLQKKDPTAYKAAMEKQYSAK